MRTFLLTWNPTRWPWDYIAQSIADVTNNGFSDDQWSCGNRRNINMGDRVFLIRLGLEPRGIVASGFVTSAAFDLPHWDPDRAKNGDTSIHVRLRFDAITEERKRPDVMGMIGHHSSPKRRSLTAGLVESPKPPPNS